MQGFALGNPVEEKTRNLARISLHICFHLLKKLHIFWEEIITLCGYLVFTEAATAGRGEPGPSCC